MSQLARIEAPNLSNLTPQEMRRLGKLAGLIYQAMARYPWALEDLTAFGQYVFTRSDLKNVPPKVKVKLMHAAFELNERLGELENIPDPIDEAQADADADADELARLKAQLNADDEDEAEAETRAPEPPPKPKKTPSKARNGASKKNAETAKSSGADAEAAKQ